MKDVAGELNDLPDFYKNNLDVITYGNRHNTYTYDTAEDYRRTLDYIVFREPRPESRNSDNFTIKVLDYR